MTMNFYFMPRNDNPINLSILHQFGWIKLPVDSICLASHHKKAIQLNHHHKISQDYKLRLNPNTQQLDFQYPLVGLSASILKSQGSIESVIVRPQTIQDLHKILTYRDLYALFQPIIETATGHLLGFEGLIRGNTNNKFHSPDILFSASRAAGLGIEMELLACQIILEAFSKLNFRGRLTLNLSPDAFCSSYVQNSLNVDYFKLLGISPKQIILEITEHQRIDDLYLLKQACLTYRRIGMLIALDDLGEGFSTLKLWSELRPDYVKIDRYFIDHIHKDMVKLEFVKAIKNIASSYQCKIIAEGIELKEELSILRDLNIDFAQGYLVARPSKVAQYLISSDIKEILSYQSISLFPNRQVNLTSERCVGKLALSIHPVSEELTNEQVHQLLVNNPLWQSVAVIDQNNIPIGLIQRNTIFDEFSMPFRRDLYAKRSCSTLMDSMPLIVEDLTPIEELGQLIAKDQRYLLSGYIITHHGKYLGIGTGHDLMREITEMQISFARYANPLTFLPGNVPINQHIDRLIQADIPFVACYSDLDRFKPFNDVYGYRKGDDLIVLTANIISQVCDPHLDFIGHIGGDDFIILFQSADWKNRCHEILSRFDTESKKLLNPEDIQRGGIYGEDRRNEHGGGYVLHDFPSLSLGAVMINKNRFHSSHEIAEQSAIAKHQSKQIKGSSLYVIE